MLSKKHNDPLYWKNKLEALDRLPVDTTAAKDILWDRLHDRLQQRPVKNKAVWFWVAAGLLPLIIITLTMINKREDALVKQLPQKEKTTNTVPAYLLPSSKESVTLSVSAPVEKKQTITTVRAKNKAEIVYDTIKASEDNITVTASPDNPAIEIVSSSLLPDTTATFAVDKKKLHIVHINELEVFPAQFTTPVNYAQSIKPAKNKTNKLSLATQQNIIGFKVKLSSKN